MSENSGPGGPGYYVVWSKSDVIALVKVGSFEAQSVSPQKPQWQDATSLLDTALDGDWVTPEEAEKIARDWGVDFPPPTTSA